ncbi:MULTISPECIES: Zn-ribbon domain-containing OB-fold protein [Mycolicibacterium]|uniref:OB-fold domain-containing protein n=3 Tax=Mycolicibacterium TaxID=1866885 RepID=A0AAE4VJ97_MYCFO|nr:MULTISPECIES: OB-fold domain-containing protein [Mycolicibacterium]MCV7142394.1 OB-fold domain-containing protein [Mycolicibacterium fortuitum]MDV7194558.1 OB-fold domain-containing protein [Mycolicibacterium fortuitum]MDV7208120.1 OB-fold domain-containing protein [Mycolicibacterium fortuitum]MDV7230014.1 OB-fold domain-containing protein [Mycolicibacterium fortuitum]MDV7261819.1 OB-fold domain-containing protein [Mycolicibacterium fortuitum]
MTQVAAIGTYLPPWTVRERRVKGPDEDALTMAVAAGRAADPDATARRVVLVSRDFPLLEGGNGGVLLAGLSLAADVPVSEVLGGAPAVLDQLLGAIEGTLVIAADDASVAGAAAVLTGAEGATLAPVARQIRSLPTTTRGEDGTRHHYGDPRLDREVGVKSTVARLRLDNSRRVAAVVGVKARELGGDVDARGAIEDPISSASGVIRALANLIEKGQTSGLLLAVEQSSVTAAEVITSAKAPTITRDEAPSRELPTFRTAEGNGIPISLPAYARAFEPKLRWEAAVFDEQPGIDVAPQFPPRARVSDDGGLVTDYRLEPLPRTGTVYTQTTIRIPVPDLPSPYSIAVVQLDGSSVRVLMKVTGVPAGEAAIGQAGSVVLRKIADRAGVPDYGYAFWPTSTEGTHA